LARSPCFLTKLTRPLSALSRVRAIGLGLGMRPRATRPSSAFIRVRVKARNTAKIDG
jgi:hypothetical protein